MLHTVKHYFYMLNVRQLKDLLRNPLSYFIKQRYFNISRIVNLAYF